MSFGKIAGFALGPIGTAAVSLVSVPVITWFFTPDDIGRIAMLQVGISFSLLFFSLGLDQVYVREYHGHSNTASLFKACLGPGLCLLIIMMLVQAFWPRLIGTFLFGESAATYSWLAALCILTTFIIRFLSLILRMEDRGLVFSLSQLLPKIGYLAMIGGIVLLIDQHNLMQLLMAHTAAILGTMLFLAWNCRQEWSRYAPMLDIRHHLELLRIGLPLVLGGLAFWGMTSLDRIFLRNLSSFDELGLYAVCVSFAGVATILQSIFSTIWAPFVYKRHTAGENPQTIIRATDHVLAAVVFMFALTGLLSWVLTFLLPSKYHEAQHIVLACLAYPLLYTLGEASGIGLGIARKTGIVTLATIAAFGVNVLLNAVLVPLHGASGAASATALSFLLLLVLRTELAARFWVPAPRRRLYALAGGCTLMSVTQALFGQKYQSVLIGMWGGVFFIATVMFKNNLLLLISWMQSDRSPAN